MEKIIDTTLNMLNQDKEREALLYFYQNALPYLNNDKLIEHHIILLYKGFGRSNQRVKRSKAILSSLLYDMLSKGRGNNMAKRCISLIDSSTATGLSASEHLYNSLQVTARGLNPKSDEELIANEDIYKCFNSDGYILNISTKHNISCYKQSDGTLVLLSFTPPGEDILCDEEGFLDDAPLYFTASSHFVSPLYKLDIAKAFIHEIMSLAGYPFVRIKQVVVYPYGSNPINEDDMWADSWRDRDMEIIKNKRNEATSIVAMDSSAMTEQLRAIIQIAHDHYDNVYDGSDNYANVVRNYVKKNIILE